MVFFNAHRSSTLFYLNFQMMQEFEGEKMW